jgi:hypothetical protein
VTASTTIEAALEAVFGVLADPSAHADIDGTDWVRGSLDGDRITAPGQVFRMAMYHPNHPDKDYRIANLVEVFDEPRAIAWKPGTESPETDTRRADRHHHGHIVVHRDVVSGTPSSRRSVAGAQPTFR